MIQFLKRWKILVLVVVSAIVFLVPSVWASSDSQDSPAQQRLVVIFDRNQKRVVLTDQKTVAEVLAQADIEISDADLVEPALDTEILSDNFNVNIFRGRPVVVIDGNHRLAAVSAHQAPEQVVRSAGVTLYPEDIVDVQLNFMTTGANTGIEYVVKRSKAINFIYYGKLESVRTQKTTVGDFLQEKDLKLTESDRISANTETPIVDGMTLEMWREGKQELVQEEDIPFEVRKIYDYDRNVSYRKVEKVGVVGRRIATYEIDIKNGLEVSRRELNSLVTALPVEQVEIVGAKSRFMPYTGGGTKTEWLVASGIPQADWGYVDWLVQKESGWNPNAVNKHSGACGLAQALPCSKVPGEPHDPVNSLRWMNGYVNGRYGSWADAVAHSKATGWY